MSNLFFYWVHLSQKYDQHECVYLLLWLTLDLNFLKLLYIRPYFLWQDQLLKLPDKTLVYPAHDYNDKKYSTIENEKNNNPRLQVKSAEEYAEIMDNLNLENPDMIDIAVPANIKGFTLDNIN